MTAAARRRQLSTRSGIPMQDIEKFIGQFNGIRIMMQKQMKGVDLDAMSNDPNAPLVMKTGKAKKEKLTRGGGGGFGR